MPRRGGQVGGSPSGGQKGGALSSLEDLLGEVISHQKTLDVLPWTGAECRVWFHVILRFNAKNRSPEGEKTGGQDPEREHQENALSRKRKVKPKEARGRKKRTSEYRTLGGTMDSKSSLRGGGRDYVSINNAHLRTSKKKPGSMLQPAKKEPNMIQKLGEI